MNKHPIVTDLEDGDQYIISSQHVFGAPDNVYLYLKDDAPTSEGQGACIKFSQESLKVFIEELQSFIDEDGND